MDKSSSYNNIMLEEPVKKLILRLSFPSIISMLITSFYNIVDTYFIGKISTSASGAIGIAFSFTAIIQALAFFFGHGSGNFISRKLGENQKEEAEKMAFIGFYAAFFLGVIIMIFGLIFKNPLSLLLGSTKTILPYTIDYLKFILLGVPFSMASFVMNNQLRFQGKAFYGMIGIGTGAVLNITLDPVFIFILRLGIKGAALATMISQIISFIMLLILYYYKSDIKLQLRNIKLNKKNPLFIKSNVSLNRKCPYKHILITRNKTHLNTKCCPQYTLKNIFHYNVSNSKNTEYFLEIIRGGTPSLLRQGISSLGTICLNLAAHPYGDEAIAAMSIVSRITYFGLAAMIGFGQGFQPVCGFNYGAKKYNRVKEAFWFCVKFGSITMLIFSIMLGIFSKNLITIFLETDSKVITYGATALRLQCITFSLNGWITMCNMMQQNLGKVLYASFLSMARQGILFIPLVYILPFLFELRGLFLVQPIADLLTFLVAIPLQLRMMRMLCTTSHL